MKIILFLSILCQTVVAFIPSKQATDKNDRFTLCMSYIDDLSPDAGFDDNDEESIDKSSSSGERKESSKLVPTGRGPLGSYLDAISSGGKVQGDEGEEKQNYDIDFEDFLSTSFEALQKLQEPSNTGAYLTNFLVGDDDARTDIRNLLTQRSIQSFLRLCEECRDPHSAKWIQQDFLKAGNLIDYHGTGAKFLEDCGGFWEVPLLSLISQPKVQIIVSSKRRGRGHGGWSKNNPYLEERWVETAIDINPANLASRIMAVREQISSEWVKDLDILIESNDLILDSFFKSVRNEGGEKIIEDDNLSSSNKESFERTAIDKINNMSSFTSQLSSPFRRSNFDLLYNLCTQSAIHRILRKGRAAGGEMNSNFLFLRNFYTKRAEVYFDGHLEFGQADEFMDELLQTPPSVSSSKDNGGIQALTDPVGTAEMIIKMRKEVAEDWKILMQNCADDHIILQQALLARQIQQDTIDQDYYTDFNAFQ